MDDEQKKKSKKAPLDKPEDLFETFVQLTGLSRETIQNELSDSISTLDLQTEKMTVDDLRKILSLYLEHNKSLVCEDSDRYDEGCEVFMEPKTAEA